MSGALIELQDVVVLRYTDPTGLFGLWGAKPTRALDGVSLQLRAGEALGVMGGAGAGKTTLAETLTMRRKVDRGRISYDGQDVTKLGGDARKKVQRRLQLIPQDARDALLPDRTIRKQFQEEMRRYGLPDTDARMATAMAQVELPQEFLDRTPLQMSGGQVQRVAIARALAMNPQLIAADEPVSGVDQRLQRDLLDLLARVQKERNLAYLVISQDLKVIRKLAHRVAIMDSGRIYECGPAEQVLQEARHPYSRLFLGLEAGAMPAEEDRAGLTVTGCPWASYCPLTTDRCRREAPAAREVAPGHVAACHAL